MTIQLKDASPKQFLGGLKIKVESSKVINYVATDETDTTRTPGLGPEPGTTLQGTFRYVRKTY